MKKVITAVLLILAGCSNIMQGAVAASKPRVVSRNWEGKAASGLGCISIACCLVWLGHLGVYSWYRGYESNEPSRSHKESEAYDDMMDAKSNSEEEGHTALHYGLIVKANAPFKQRQSIFGWLTIATAVAAAVTGMMSMVAHQEALNLQKTA